MSRRKRHSGKKSASSSSQTDKRVDNGVPQSPALPQEDAKLWAQVTKSLEPLKGKHERLHFGPLRDEKPALPEDWLEGGKGPSSEGKAVSKQNSPRRSQQRRGKASHDTLPVARRIPDLSDFTRREMRHVTSGRQSIEAKLDLHGLRQAEAHIALKGFLVHSQDQGLRHVLVITGKGRSGPRDSMMFGEPEPGVLRRKVPLWLSDPDLRHIVAGYTDAPLRHGGDGALYVRLRRAR